MMPTELHPWPPLLAIVLDFDSTEVVSLIDRTGLVVDWSLAGDHDYSNKTRKRAYRPRIEIAFQALNETAQLRTVRILTHELLQRHPENEEAVRTKLAEIGCQIDDGRRLEAKKEFITCQECDEKVPFIDFIEQRLTSDPVARKILAMDETATRELDTQALEQILIGHMMAIAGEANQIFRPVTMFDHGIDGEVEFKDNDGKASGKRIYIQLKSGNSYLRTRKGDGSEVFDVKDDRHLEYWISHPADVYLVIRQTDELSGQQVIRWMNVTRHLKARKDKKSRQIIFAGEKLDMEAVWKVRDEFFPKA